LVTKKYEKRGWFIMNIGFKTTSTVRCIRYFCNISQYLFHKSRWRNCTTYTR